MGSHEGRLNESESRIWDRCFRYYVKTGKWIFEEALKRKDNKMGMTDGKNLDMEEVPVVSKEAHSALGGQPLKATDEEIEMCIDGALPFEAPMVHGLMPKRDGRHPVSRDYWLEGHTFLCDVSSCAANKRSNGKGKCICPSLIAIDSHHKCTGYHPRKDKS